MEIVKMGKLRNSQHGFEITGVLVVIVVVVVTAGSGLLFYRHSHKTSAKSNTTTSSITSTQQPVTNTTQPAQAATPITMDIREWGVHVNLDSATATMYYYINPTLPDVAYVSLKTIGNIAPNCAADKGALGAIARLTEAEQQAATANSSNGSEPGTIKIGNYWYSVGTSHANCTDNAAERASISQALPNYNQGELLEVLSTLAAD